MIRLRLVSDFNIEILGRYLNSAGPATFHAETAPFGQVIQSLDALGRDPGETDAAIVWTRPEGLFESYRRALDFQTIDHESVLAEADGYLARLKQLAGRVKYLLHASWTLPAGHRGHGMLDFSSGLGLSHLLARLNLRLADTASNCTNLFVLNAEQWLRQGGPRPWLPKMWFAGKVPFKNAVFQAAAHDVQAALEGLSGRSRKLVVVDLDNTLWGGVVGETGWEGIRLGGHDHVGEAYVEFQQSLRALANRGIQLAIVSKNDEYVALEAIDRHPEMRLRRQHFAGWRINWTDKAANIADLVQELRLGLDSVVFIDDNPAERGRVREALGSQVMVPDWPADPADFSSALLDLRCFDVPFITLEDRERTEMYAAERARRHTQEAMESAEDWLASLNMKVLVEPLSTTNLPRTAQLLNKTNQMNMRTRRLSEGELKAWASGPGRMLWTFRVADRFGDTGLTGIISVEMTGDTAHVIDFVMSCRVMGRKVEEAMFHTAVAFARTFPQARWLTAEYLPTERNGPCLAFLKRSSFEEQTENRFYWPLDRDYPWPSILERETAEPLSVATES